MGLGGGGAGLEVAFEFASAQFGRAFVVDQVLVGGLQFADALLQPHRFRARAADPRLFVAQFVLLAFQTLAASPVLVHLLLHAVHLVLFINVVLFITYSFFFF